MASIKINDVDLELDLDDLNVADKVEKAIQTVKDRAESEKDTTDYVRSGRKVCSYIEECFNGIFGEDTAEKLFGGRVKFREHIDAFAQLAEATVGQLKEQSTYMTGLTAKYSPNRVARRHPAKK